MIVRGGSGSFAPMLSLLTLCYVSYCATETPSPKEPFTNPLLADQRVGAMEY